MAIACAHTTDTTPAPDKKISINCAICEHTVVHEVANLLLVVDDKATTHDVRKKATCPKCLTVGDNTYRVV